MKLQKIIFLFAFVGLLTIGCKNKTENTEVDITQIESELVVANPQKIVLNISGMTCEIGCAKFIQSKLSKKEGVLEAKVIFTDSIANVEFDANRISKQELIALVNGLADGEMYKAFEYKNE